MADRPKILVIDDEIGDRSSDAHADFLSRMGAALGANGAPALEYPYEFEFCSAFAQGAEYSVELALNCLRDGWEPTAHRIWSLVLLDVRFGKQRSFGYEVLAKLRSLSALGSDVPVVMLTSQQETRQEAAQGNANGFLPKVTHDGKPGLTRAALESVMFREGLIPDVRPSLPDETFRVVGRSLPLLKALRAIRRNVRDGAIRQVCLLGESGVGKEWIARYAHGITRPGAPFISRTADPSNPSIELSDIFGCWPGAHSQAPRSGPGMPGAFELAHGGTLFLDEVANLSVESQRRLLEVRTRGGHGTRVISRFGTAPLTDRPTLARCQPHIRGHFDEQTGSITVDVNMVTATNARLDDPAQLGARGFLPDLWYGLQPYVVVPSLRERSGDAPLLFAHFMRSKLRRAEVNIHEEVGAALNEVDWSVHGNIRGIERAAETAVLRYDDFGVVTTKQLPADLFGPSPKLVVAVPEARNPDPAPAAVRSSPPFAQVLVNRYRDDLRRFADELAATADKTQLERPKLVPARALSNLLGKRVSGADIGRLIQKLFMVPVFAPPKTLRDSLEKYGLKELQQWVINHPLLREFARQEDASETE